MLVDLIFLVLFAAAWLFLAMLSWIALSVRRRAVGALWAAPFAALGGIGGGAMVPLAGLDTQLGIAVSMLSAFCCAGLACLLSFRAWDAFALDKRFAKWSRRAE